MSQDAQMTDRVLLPGGSSGPSVHEEIQGATAIPKDIATLCQGRRETEYSLPGGDGETIVLDEVFGLDAEEASSGEVKEKETNSYGQQQLAIEHEYHGGDTAAVCSEDSRLVSEIDEGDAKFTHLDEGAKTPHGTIAANPKLEIEGETHCLDLGLDHIMDERRPEAEMHSPTLRHMSEFLEEATQDSIMEEEPGDRGHERAQGSGLAERYHGSEFETRQAEREASITINEGSVLAEHPIATETHFENQSKCEILPPVHDQTVRREQYGRRMVSGTADPLPDLQGGEIRQPSEFTKALEAWRGYNPTMSSNVKGVIRKEAVAHLTKRSNASFPDLWSIAGMNDVQNRQTFDCSVEVTNKFIPPHSSIQNIPMTFTNPNSFPQFQPPTHCFPQKQPLNPFSQAPVDPSFNRQQQLQAKIEEKRRQVENVKRLYEQNLRQNQQGNGSFGFAQNQTGGPASFLTGPLSYQRAPRSASRELPPGNNNPNQWAQIPSGFSYSLEALNDLSASCFTQDQEMVSKPIGLKDQTPGPSTAQESSKARQQDMDEDDEPLITRTKRHISITSGTSDIYKSPATQQKDHLSDVELSTQATANSPSATTIDWKLPQYDIQLQPASINDSSVPTAKVSLPGLVREELLLSPDHFAQEVHLFVNVFLPAQRALASPDPSPAVAVLNFHTIALMVIEAYVQYEIGDELGRSNPYYHDPVPTATAGKGKAPAQDLEYERIRDARTADVDDIFFAVIDRWRAGRESNKQSLRLIRGVQEFCDVALDVIFYIKEYGLLVGRQQEEEKEKEKKKEREKADGVAVLKARQKGKRVKKEEDEGAPRKRGKKAEIVKVEKKGGEKKKKEKEKGVGVMVVKR